MHSGKDCVSANPYGVLALPGKTYVVDAGSNTLDLVRANGSVQILAFAPKQPSTLDGGNRERKTYGAGLRPTQR